MSQELKPCPFCGKTDRLEVRRPMQVAATNYRNVWCDRCGFWGPSGQDASHFDKKHLSRSERLALPVINAKQSAIDAWNRRPVE